MDDKVHLSSPRRLRLAVEFRAMALVLFCGLLDMFTTLRSYELHLYPISMPIDHHSARTGTCIFTALI